VDGAVVDVVERGHGSTGGVVSVCKRGHEPTEENIYVRPNGWRTCLPCRREREERQRWGESFEPNATKTVCVRGHDLTDPENVRVYNGRRNCRTCIRERGRTRRGTGRPVGRPPWVPTEQQQQAILTAIADGLTYAQTADAAGVTPSKLAGALGRDPALAQAVVVLRKARHCGTAHGYNRGCRCDRCRAAHRQGQAEYRRRRFELTRTDGLPDGVRHGVSAYTNWGCRCDVCSAEHHDEMARQYARRKAAGLQKAS
jgi:hypothetical protein